MQNPVRGLLHGTAALLEVGGCGMRAAIGTDQVGGQDLLPEVLAHGVQILEGNGLHGVRGTGVVDQVVQTSQGVHRGLDHGTRLLGIRDVARSGHHLQARTAQGRHGAGTRLVPWQVVERNPRTAAREQGGRGQPDP